jgi:hypothetical protein
MSEEQVGGDAADTDTYALKSAELPEIAAPQVPYRPPRPKSYRPKIGMIGTGGISASHLDAYRTAGWDVAALWNRTRSKAEEKAAEYCPTPALRTTGPRSLPIPKSMWWISPSTRNTAPRSSRQPLKRASMCSVKSLSSPILGWAKTW